MNQTITMKALSRLIVIAFLLSPLAALAQIEQPHQGTEVGFSLKEATSDHEKPLKTPTPESLQRFFELHGIQNRIVGGDEVDILEYPWQVSLQLQPQYGGGHFCGGTIINSEWILTASHCLVWDDVDFQPQFMRIRAGFTEMSSTQGSYHNVSEFFLHPEYNDNSHRNDIALVRLSTPIDLTNPAAQSVQIVTQADAAEGLTDPGVMAKVSGWGVLFSDGPSPDHLMGVAVPIKSTSQSSYPSSMITADMILAGEAGLDACQGDSGGPMVVPDGFGGYKIAGVVSWGNGCGLPGFPGVYSRVSYFEDWIGQYVVVSDPNQYTNLWTEGFEPALQGGALPNGWTLKKNTAADGGINGANLQDVTAAVPRRWFRISPLAYPYTSGTAAQFVRSGEAAMHIYWDTPDFNWAISPDITLPSDADELQLSFWTWQNSTPADNYITKLYVNIFVDGQWETIASLDDGTPNLFNNSVDIPISDYLGETVQFAFIHQFNDGYQLSIDDISIRYQNPGATANFRVSDGENLIEGAKVDVEGVGTFFTGVDGTIPVPVFIGPNAYDYTVVKSGFFPFSGSVLITGDNQQVEVVLEKIPAPEIEVSPESLVLEVFQGQTLSQALTIANTGDADLTYSLFSVPAVKSDPRAEIAQNPVMYNDILADGRFSALMVPTELSLNSPEEERQFEQVEIHYDSGPGGNSIGTGSAANWISAVRFTPEELNQYYGMYEMSAIKFHINGETFSSVTAKIWKGGSEMGPAEEIYSAEVTSEVQPNDFTTHVLPENIYLEPGNEYWVGYQIQATSGHPSTVDAGPMVEYKGAWMFFNSGWAQLTDLNAQLNYNWVIRGVLDPILGVDWLSFDPVSGTIAPGGEANPMLLFDATELELGEYQANVVVRSNAGADILVPVTLNVVPPAYLVEFEVKDELGNPVNDAVITLGGQTNAAGDYEFIDQPAGTYAYTIEKADYLTATGSVLVVDQDLFLSISMIPEGATTYDLTVTVIDEFESPVEDAYFTLQGGGASFTDAQGQLTLSVVSGQYNFSISKEGMVPQSGNVTVLDEDMALGITLSYLRYQVTLAAEPATGGTVLGGGEYYHGQSATVTAGPADYHSFLHWTENDEVVSEIAEYMFEVTGPRNLVAHFEIFSYVITAAADPAAGGTVTGAGTYDHGTQVSLVAQPAINYQFLHWTEDGEVIEGALASYAFTAESDRDLVAVFELTQHTLTIVKVGEGITDPAEGEHVYTHGTQVTLTATNSGMWEFVKWTVGPQTIPGNPVTVTVNNDMTVTATFQDVTSVTDPDAPEGLTVYPNPSAGRVFVKISQQISQGLLRVVDAAGNIVFALELKDMTSSQTLELDAATWNRGIYFVSLTSDKGVQTLPLVISR
ncbi:MAG: trypsin-like serine protease [Bacteroidales bacterium]|jgi:secreted trypsin-like serine protease/uncharacterized membrane protein|nr:trypsin-like serine protease [Bacteroidales bacterium]NLM93157.1 trypsin-like serine protease [Bacteroidales bacterium]